MSLTPELKNFLAETLLILGDDELILGHRDSEWCGHAPILEEDIAFANLALDEIGHAMVWYGLLAELRDEDPESYADQLVFQRDAADFRSAQFVELEKGDWAFSMIRQYLFDAAEMIRLKALAESNYQPLAEAAGKIYKEEIYHYRHTSAWVRRLGLGTEESQRRMQTALDSLWGYALGLFVPSDGETPLVVAGCIPSSEAVKSAWLEKVTAYLKDSGLTIPDSQPVGDDRKKHHESFTALIEAMQRVARLDPTATW